MQYSVGTYREDGKYFVWIPDLKIRFESSYTSPGQIKVEARAALMEELQEIMNRRAPVPLPASTTESIMKVFKDKKFKECRAAAIKLPVYVYAKIKAYRAWIDSGLSERALANKSGLSQGGVRGIWELAKSSELKSIAMVCKACGYEMEVAVRKKSGASS